ncbi:MAG: FHA domain-containing protein [Prevotella sp.]|nr:FHA domain-containing protein [Prevotella sp.]
MSKCYKCGADIDSDSLFCDQCGAEQYVCPKCHIIGKGPNKRCGMCGSPLVPATGQQGNNSTQQQGAAQPFAGAAQQQGAAQPFAGAAQQQGATQQQEATRMASYLVCQAEQVSIPLMNGAVIGRTAGDYANLLGKCIYISGMHARLTQNGSVWHITDLGSRNGTKVNGVACQPNVPMAFKTGDTIKLGAFYDFRAE